MEKLDKVVPAETLQGDTTPMPSRGTGTGVTDTYGAQTGPNSTNRLGNMAGSTKSDGMEAA